MYNFFKKVLIFISIFFLPMNAIPQNNNLAYDFNFISIDGKPLKLSNFKEKLIVVINVASQCGFTKQYRDMQNIWEKYSNKGVIIIGVPSNDFGNQEPGTNQEIKNFCESKFGITFPMTEKVNVVGNNAHPFYIWAKKSYGQSSIPKWNFHKIIIGKNGKVEKTFTSLTNPSSDKFINYLNENL